MISIIDYGASNLRSVAKAFEFLGIPVRFAERASDVARADKLILPGVGAFGKAIEAVRQHKFAEAIGEHLDKGKPLLGICLGMQLLLTESEEMGQHQGLNVIAGKVKRFDDTKDKVPQIGWNSLDFIRRDALLFKGIDEGAFVYFVHSYYCVPEVGTAAEAYYAGQRFTAAIEKNSIFAVQFHPEKSGETGLRILKNFAQL
ncbi:MAG: imidazole glycerol phosphate synthase subunit HisH [Chloroherpetonaceae bacterium]|nr:imidazole glycerol phosphate synthase subunit HisH [Chloroherpetonaceae bacterium]MDW8018936.1 imidazole glycerol phosphate synthase subunit HisH [Chloroherpetonaceae bacterium]